MMKSKAFMPRSLWPFPKLRSLLAFNFWQVHLVLLGVAVAVWGIVWLLLGHANPTQEFLSTFIIGNCAAPSVFLAPPIVTNQ